MTRTVAVAVVALALGLVGAARAGAGGGFDAFRTPSGNIHCDYAVLGEAVLRCDILSGLNPRPAKPRTCQLGWGRGFSLAPRGAARFSCTSDTVVVPGSRVLQYGNTWRRGPFACVSRSIGLRCSNRVGRGFFLSRERSYRF